MKHPTLALLLFASSSISLAQIPHPSSGTIKRFENFPSRFVAARTIDVWLPDRYDPKQRYAVVYMHDGQSLFDSTIVWNKQEWGVDEVLGKLMAAHKIRNCIVVGVWNTPLRHSEYFPQKPFESLTKSRQDSIFDVNSKGTHPLFKERVQSDAYLKFLVKELKPFIDSCFSTRKDRSNTFVAGSSMGGLISMYAICEYPEVFGGAACLSTHWPGVFTTEGNPIPAAFMRYLGEHLPSPKNHKLYFDYGTKTLDASYKPFQQQADFIIKAKGYTSKNWMTQEFPGADHTERSWNKRLEIPMMFLLKR